MKRSELVSRLLIATLVLGVIVIPLAVGWKSAPLLIHARMPENGGWSIDSLKATVGEPLQLRLTSDDVVHGFAVGQLDFAPVDVLPGKVSEVTLIFDKPGTYTFYCNRWCGINHWRMRGTIEVSGEGFAPEPASKPYFVIHNVDIDAPHEAVILPQSKPRTAKELMLSSSYLNFDYYLSRSPEQTWQELRADSLWRAKTDEEIWSFVARLWQGNTTPEALMRGEEIFAQNCAACHGENGKGDGVFAEALQAAGEASLQTMAGAHDMAVQAPPDLTDVSRILGASPAILQGKILRGGMGTGMPMWGVILTEEQIWDVVAFIYSFQFDYQP